MNDTADPILLEVINNALTAIGDEMGNTMKRTARSITARAGDFSTVLVDARGRVISQGHGAGFHLGYIRGVMPALMAKFAGKLRPGDILASNDPYGGLSHLPDIVLLAPIFWRDSLLGFSTLVTHHSDIGGRFPGGQSAVCAEIFEEGLRLPCVKLYDQGSPNQALFEVIAGNVRTPDDVLGDLEGQAAACRRGIRGVQELVDKYGLERFEACVAQLHRFSERVVRAAIAKIPDGDYPYADHFEEDGLGGPGVDLKLCIKVRGDSIIVDFSGTGAQVKSAINVPYSLTCSASYVCFRGVLAADAPANDGLLEPIEVIAPKGCVLNPRFPAAIGGRGMMLWRICDMIFGALAKAIPERIFAAGEGGVSSFTAAYSDVEPGASPVLTDWYSSGWGARPTMDGIDGVNSMLSGNGGATVPVERLESEFPISDRSPRLDVRHRRCGKVSRRAVALSYLPVFEGGQGAGAHLPRHYGSLRVGRRRRRHSVSGGVVPGRRANRISSANVRGRPDAAGGSADASAARRRRIRRRLGTRSGDGFG